VCVCLCVNDAGGGWFTAAEKLLYSAIADFSSMLTADTDTTYKRLLRALTKSKVANRHRPLRRAIFN